MPICAPNYALAVEALTPELRGLPSKLVTIDGRDGAGKTTLGRFLAWYFNVTLVETDLFLIKGKSFTYRQEEINRIIAGRLARHRPVIVEGIAVMCLLSLLDRHADFSIYVRNTEFTGSDELSGMLLDYEKAYKPETSANLVLELTAVS